jgi:hypothetical protein
MVHPLPQRPTAQAPGLQDRQGLSRCEGVGVEVAKAI